MQPLPPSQRRPSHPTAAPGTPDETHAATRWLAAVGVEPHLDFDLLYEITAEPARLRALAPLRRHLRACGPCRRQWLELRAQAGILGAALPAPRPAASSGWRASLNRLLQAGFARPVTSGRTGAFGWAGAGWGAAAIAGVLMVIVSIGWRDQATTGSFTAQAMSPSEAAQLLRSLGPDAAPYGLILETQGLQALERRLSEDESRSATALRARCLLYKREACR